MTYIGRNIQLIKILPSFAYAKEGKRAHASRSVFGIHRKRFAPKPLSIYEISNFKAFHDE